MGLAHASLPPFLFSLLGPRAPRPRTPRRPSMCTSCPRRTVRQRPRSLSWRGRARGDVVGHGRKGFPVGETATDAKLRELTLRSKPEPNTHAASLSLPRKKVKA